MKKIKITNIEFSGIKQPDQELDYEIFGKYGAYQYTEFYNGVKETTRKKYWLFGETITVSEPNLVFILYGDIEDVIYTKAEIRARIIRQLKLLNRKQEIIRGEII